MEAAHRPVRWGVLGTANIAAHAFLPALHAAGGNAALVGSRTPQRATQWAARWGVDHAVTYDDVINDEQIDAIYIALPNDLHVGWAKKALVAGKAVLCEKPLGLSPSEVQDLLEPTAENPLLWESFVFPFHPQTDTVQSILRSAKIGDLREIVSEFHFTTSNRDNIRFRPERGGGALYDVGCYPIRLARLLTGDEPTAATGISHAEGADVDLDMASILEFPRQVRLTMSAGISRRRSTLTRIIGTSGEVQLTNPFHPEPTDTIQVKTDHVTETRSPNGPHTVFQHAIEHINGVVLQAEEPRFLARDDSLGQARAVQLVQAGQKGSPCVTDPA